MQNKTFDAEYWIKENYFAISDLKGPDYMDRRILKDGLSWDVVPSKTAQEAIKFFKENDINEVLDVGCGYARDAYYFATKGINVTGIEHSELAVRTANDKFKSIIDKEQNRNWGNLKVIHNDFRKWIPYRKYPTIFTYKTFHQFRNIPDTVPNSDSDSYSEKKHYLKDPFSVKKIINKIKDCLLPNGYLVLSTFNTNDKNFGEGKFIEGNTWDNRGFRPCTFYTEELLTELLKDFKIEIIKNDFLEPEDHKPDGKHNHNMIFLIGKYLPG